MCGYTDTLKELEKVMASKGEIQTSQNQASARGSKADVPPSKEETKTSKLDRPSSDLQFAEFHKGFSNIRSMKNANVYKQPFESSKN